MQIIYLAFQCKVLLIWLFFSFASQVDLQQLFEMIDVDGAVLTATGGRKGKWPLRDVGPEPTAINGVMGPSEMALNLYTIG